MKDSAEKNSLGGLPPARVERWSSEQGSLELRFFTPSVILFVYTGHAERAQIDFFVPIIDAVIASGARPVMFTDSTGVTTVEPGFRARITDWSKRIGPHSEPIRLLLRSSIVKMAVAVSNMVLGQEFMIPYSDRLRFEADLRDSLARAKCG